MNPKKLEQLESDQFRGYLLRPLPVPEDQRIADLLWQLFNDGRGADWSSEGLSRGVRDILNTFSERMASLAVRDQEPGHLRVALLALVLGGLDQGDRGSIPVAALIFESAQRLEMDPVSLFGTMGLQIGEPGLSAFRAFTKRSEHDRSIGAMGYRLREKETGLLYQRTW